MIRDFLRKPSLVVLTVGFCAYSLWSAAAVAVVPVPVTQVVESNQSGPISYALHLLYGNDAQIGVDKDTSRQSAIWKPTQAVNMELFPNADTELHAISTVNLALPITMSGTREYLVLTESNPYSAEEKAATNGCHACSPALGGVLLKQQGGVWHAEISTFHIATLGSWGRLPGGQLILIGPNKFAVRFDLDDTAQGDTASETVIVGVVGNELKEIADISTGSSDMDGTCAMEEDDAKEQRKKFNGKLWCYQYSADYKFVADEKTGYYDLVVNYAGTDVDVDAKVPEGMKILDISRTDTYKWDGKGYKRVSTVKTPPR